MPDSPARKQTAFRLPTELLARMDGAVGDGMPWKDRTALVVAAVEKVLMGLGPDQPTGRNNTGAPPTGASLPSSSAPSRPSKPERLERARASADVRPASWMLERQRKLNEGR